MSIRAHDVIRALAASLSADAVIAEQTGEGGVHAHFAPHPPASPAWARIIITERSGEGGVEDHPTGVHLPVAVRVEARGYPDTPLLIEAVHHRVRTVFPGVLVGALIGLRRYPTPPHHTEPAKGFAFHSTALYSVITQRSV